MSDIILANISILLSTGAILVLIRFTSRLGLFYLTPINASTTYALLVVGALMPQKRDN